ncbi:AMP-binding protein [Cellulomonas xiejunii]|uniref:AMP-binding protein n=1 Tax=Cellulomonas xiejunii TaxID=2968083 RepID=UPI001D0EC2AC|nr:AMP-binding protein [Cellulomonas xiejunii]MCC2314664.1 AMP-binding protein [Cellulomonas xiejunii]
MRLEELASAQARADGGRVAVRWGAQTLTYAELWNLSEVMVGRLVASGVGAGDRVVVWTRKSPAVVALFHACLRLGAAYVPVAPSNPVGRLLRIAQECRPVVVVVDDETPGPTHLDEAPWDVVTLASLQHRGSDLDGAAPPPRDDPDELAYILFTSGSTGVPKGVCVSHRNALAFVLWAVDATGLTCDDRLANHAPFNFDLSVFDLYGALAVGASVDIVPEEESYVAGRLLSFLVDRRVTVWYSVPSVMSLLVTRTELADVGPRLPLRRMVLAGEPISVPHLRRAMAALPGTAFSNWYGPTETNVCAAYDIPSPLPEDVRTIPIGTAASGAELHLEAADDGATTTLRVEGPSVMLGYWGARPTGGVHDTGDVVQVDDRGLLVFSHRADTMLKIRGNRADATEIEACLESHPEVAAAAVVVDGEGIDAQLVAFVVPGASAGRPGLLTLKAHLGDRLPTYMNVDRVVVVEVLPLSPNGKKDRRALHEAMTTTAPAPQAVAH